MRKSKLMEDYQDLAYDAVSLFAHAAIRQTTGSAFIAKGTDLVKPLA